MSTPSKLQTFKAKVYDSIFKKPPQTPSKLEIGIPEVPPTVQDSRQRDDSTVDLDAPSEDFDLGGHSEMHESLTEKRLVLTTLHNTDDVEASNLTELSDNLKFSVLNKAYADVVMRIGTNDQVIYAHKMILAYRSSYFHDLFSKKVDLVDKSTGMIKLDLGHIIAEPFLKVLDFLYTGVARLKQDDVLDVFSLTEEFGIPTLKEMCSEYIQDSVDVENSCMLLEMGRELNCRSLETFCFYFIDKNIQRVLSTKGFDDLSEATLLQILSRDTLELTQQEEIDIFHAVYRWTKNRYLCYSKDKNCTPDHANKELREISKRIITHVRFPLMNSEQISSIVEPKNFVPQELLFEAYKFHLNPSQEHPVGVRFTTRGVKTRNGKSFITTRHVLNPIKRDSLGKRQGSFEKCDSPLKKVHFEPVPFSQDGHIGRNNV